MGPQYTAINFRNRAMEVLFPCLQSSALAHQSTPPTCNINFLRKENLCLFYTSLTGLNAAATELSVTSNNIANSGTTSFKRSDAEFGDIFASSSLQRAAVSTGSGTVLLGINQNFTQGSIESSGNSLDLAVTGDGFFPNQDKRWK